MPSRLKNHHGIYLITPDTDDTGWLLAVTERLLQSPVALLQYRHKTAPLARREAQASALLSLCQQAKVPLLINDDWALAKAIGADGVHLGEHDADPAHARAALGRQAIIGVSCYNDLARATRLADLDVDYLAFGAVFASATKPQAPRTGLHVFGEARDLGKALVAIGGITPDNSGLLRAAGADLIAVISGVFHAPDPAAALAAYHHSFCKGTE